jgi:hypothetical protein
MSGNERPGRGRSAGSQKNWFEEGVCPNPGGRPKGRRTVRDCIDEVLDEEIEAGAQRHTKRELLAKSMVNNCFQSPEYALRTLRWQEGDRPPPSHTGETDDATGDDHTEDEEIIAKALERKSRMQVSAASQPQGRDRNRKRR